MKMCMVFVLPFFFSQDAGCVYACFYGVDESDNGYRDYCDCAGHMKVKMKYVYVGPTPNQAWEVCVLVFWNRITPGCW